MRNNILNLFEIYYNSGQTVKECVVNGPAALKSALNNCSLEELNAQAKQLGICTKGLDRDQLTAQMISKVTSIAEHSNAFGDY